MTQPSKAMRSLAEYVDGLETGEDVVICGTSNGVSMELSVMTEEGNSELLFSTEGNSFDGCLGHFLIQLEQHRRQS